MPFLNLPDFEPRQVLTAAQLDQLVAALSGFAATAADITWPLVAGGNIDMGDQYQIINLQTLWNVKNAAEYASLQLAIDAAEADGGGCVFIPPNASPTITADGVNIESSNIWIVGCGPDSVIQSTGSSGYSIRTATTGLSNIGLVNVRMDGNSVSGQDGIQFRFVDGVTVKGVTFEDWDGDALVLTHSGSTGDSCQHVSVTDCLFTGGGGAHISGIDIDTGIFANIVSDSATATAALDFEPGDSSGLLTDLTFSNIRIKDATGIGMQVLGASATASANWSQIDISNVQVYGATGNAMVIGDTLKILKHVTIKGCSAPDTASGAIPLTTNIEEGKIDGNFFPNSSPDVAMDLTDSVTLEVSNNNVILSSSVSIDKSSTSNLRCGNNYGNVAPTPASIFFDTTDYSIAAGATGDMGFAYTVPAYTVKVGDVIRAKITFGVTWDTSNSTALALQLGGTTVSGTGNISQTADLIWQVDMCISALTGASNIHQQTALIEDGTVGKLTINESQVTVDLTTSNDFTLSVTSNGGTTDSTVKNIELEFIGGK